MKQRIKSFIPTTLVAEDPGGYYVGVAIAEVAQGQYVTGTGRCRSYNFPPVRPAELAESLAVVELAKNLRAFEAQHVPASSKDDIQRWFDKLKSWKRHGRSGLGIFRSGCERTDFPWDS